MGKKILIFCDNGINKNNFHKRKQPSNINKIDIKRIATSDEDSYGNKSSFKYFIEYKNKECTRPLRIKFPQLSGYAKYFNNNDKCINFVAHNKKLKRVSSLIKNGLIVSQAIIINIFSIKINLYNGKTSTNFRGKRNTRRKCALCLFAFVL